MWVFCPPNCEPSVPLYLSTTIDNFADIWGPLWKMKDRGSQDKYVAYIVGGGTILPWQHNPLQSPKLVDERFCHWICNEDLEAEAPDIKPISPPIPFDETKKLLIGAPTKNYAAVSSDSWIVNSKCSRPISIARTQLREAGRLCIIGASKPYHYNDSNQYQLQVGYSGVNASVTRQYKRVPGQSLKEVLIELSAMEPELRDPKLLEDLHGVEISLCTFNAQRVPLAQIMRLQCVQHLLRDFNWQDPEYRTEYFLTLEDTLRPRRLLDPQFKERFDSAIMLSLKMLGKTGVDRSDNLQVFLSSACTPKPELATMTAKEHSWVGLLKDTRVECAMVAFGDSCLEFKHHNGISCGTTGQSALLSAIILHSSISRQLSPPNESTTDNQSSALGLGISALEAERNISLGERGELRLISNLSAGILLMRWCSNSTALSLRSRLSRHIVHREFTEIDDTGTAQPVPIIVLSDPSGWSVHNLRIGRGNRSARR